ncbi:MAG: NB-ARC domain-containing protein [Desulfuromonadales bacterium]
MRNHIFYDSPCKVDLIHSDSEASDFFLVNGSFTDKKFEFLSYITGNKFEGDSTQYLKPANELPASETQGLGDLDTQGNVFGNLPNKPTGYIKRELLEQELHKTLFNDRHPVVTLVGRGGIGKTSLALSVLHDISVESRFAAIIWFSARDIDLLPQGPKIVKPHILSVKDIAKEFVRLLNPVEKSEKFFDSLAYFSQYLSQVPVGPILFVFDNFETVINPSELFAWLDTYIRLPNKILITTRHRDFKGDYPIEVTGMSDNECQNLINTTAQSLQISSLLSSDYIRQVTEESEGHPYVIKVLLGEVAKANKLVKIDRIIASKDDILEALFERTYSGLSPAAKRVYLTLCNWRSTVPSLAVEAVLMRPGNEKLDVAAAIEELSKSSFIEIAAIEGDDALFISVPLAAAVFGSRKLTVDPYKSAIELDLKLLQYFGASQIMDMKHGIHPRIERLFKHLADKISKGIDKLDDHIPMLEFIARKYPPAWLLLGRLFQENNGPEAIEKETTALRHYLEFMQDDETAKEVWERILSLSRLSGDIGSEIHALYEICALPCADYKRISDCANRINSIFRENFAAIDTDEKRYIVEKIVSVMERRLDEADATDLSRLSWLCLHLKDELRAREYANKGYQLDNNNEYCAKLINKYGLR